jgi:nitroreductase
MIVLVADHNRLAKGSIRYLEDYACATTQMLLAATALDYAAGWVDGPRRPKKPFSQRASWNYYAVER